MLWHWSVDVKKSKKTPPKVYKILIIHNGKVHKALDFLSANKWITGGKIYIRRRPSKGFIRESPVLISVVFKENIPKYEYVSLGFVLSEEIPRGISIVDQNKGRIGGYLLIGEF